MALPVVWTENALEDYLKVVDYLLQNWSVEIASKFIDTVESRLDTLVCISKLRHTINQGKNDKSNCYNKTQ